MGIAEYFSLKDRNTLLRRELHAILQSIEESTNTPYNVNVTLYTLPTLCRLPFTWNGGIEIVEWERSISPYFKRTKRAISELQERGLTVWADDVTADTMNMWLNTGIDGFKVELQEIQENKFFLGDLQSTQKPIILERIETEEQHNWAKQQGITLAQGFYYGVPEKPDKVIRKTVSL